MKRTDCEKGMKLGKIKAKKNNFRCIIIPYDRYLYNEEEKRYVYIKDLITNNFINTDWADVRFDKKEAAKEWCRDFVIKHKEIRITNHIQQHWIGRWAYVN
jgi:translation initiation factor IF-3